MGFLIFLVPIFAMLLPIIALYVFLQSLLLYLSILLQSIGLLVFIKDKNKKRKHVSNALMIIGMALFFAQIIQNIILFIQITSVF